MKKKQFIAIQTELSYTNKQMAEAIGLSERTVNNMRGGKLTDDVTRRVAIGAKNALDAKISKLIRLRSCVV